MDECMKKRIETTLKENLKEKRLIHTYAVADEAEKLATRYGEDIERARTAALLHDMYRNLSPAAMTMYIKQLAIDDRYIGNVNLAHSKIAAVVMKLNYGIEDEDMINAVSYHTTGRAGMSLLEKIIFLADAIEPARNYPGVDEVRKEAYIDIDRACILSLEGTISFLRSKDAYIDSDTIDALNYLKEQRNI